MLRGKKMTGIIFDIQRFCVKDGPGIRTTVFFKGCPLRCLWCHNPESQRSSVEEMQKAKEEGAELCGREYTVEEVLEIVDRDRLFYENSNGGLTLSGGEPLYQGEFALALMKKAKEQGLHIALETCGMAAEEMIRESARYADLYLYDFKESDPCRHREYTGAGNGQILKNLALLNRLGKAVILRCPIIPGYNDREEHFEKIAALAEQLDCIQKIEIEPYHSFGADKYRRLHRNYLLAEVKNPEKAEAERWAAIIQSKTAKAVERA